MADFRQPENPQLNAHGELIHLLSTEGLPREILLQILDTAAQCFADILQAGFGHGAAQIHDDLARVNDFLAALG